MIECACPFASFILDMMVIRIAVGFKRRKYVLTIKETIV
jgi:hypothetical protein